MRHHKLLTVSLIATLLCTLITTPPATAQNTTTGYEDPRIPGNTIFTNVKDMPPSCYRRNNKLPSHCAMLPLTFDGTWINQYDPREEYKRVRFYQENNKLHGIPSLPKEYDLPALQRLHTRISKQLLQAVPQWHQHYEWIYYIGDDNMPHHPNGVNYYSVGGIIDCPFYIPCWTSGRTIRYELQLQTGYAATFPTWEQASEFFFRLRGYIAHLTNGDANLTTGRVPRSPVIYTLETYTYIYPLNTRVPFELHVVMNTDQDKEPGIDFHIISPFIPSTTDGSNYPQIQPDPLIR